MANFTKQAIKAAFLELLKELPLTRISVRTLSERCGINRNTFYYHYPDIPALLEDIILEETNALIRLYPSISSLKEAARVAFDFAMQNREAILHIYHSVTLDVFVENALRLCNYTVTAYISS
ncbi:MAG: TetR family transcriptional regulator, partial [Parasporobacterium sp.]|nr:TetR family transcriptional regulator [Parasporobacterium sp.]